MDNTVCGECLVSEVQWEDALERKSILVGEQVGSGERKGKLIQLFTVLIC